MNSKQISLAFLVLIVMASCVRQPYQSQNKVPLKLNVDQQQIIESKVEQLV